MTGPIHATAVAALSDIPLALREDGSPPLYYMLLHFWLDLAGSSEQGVRALSLLFGLPCMTGLLCLVALLARSTPPSAR